MPKQEYPCGQCGRPVVGLWKATTGWVSMQWTDTLPVQMRTRNEVCPYCNVSNDVIEIRPKDTSKLIKIKKPKKKNG